MSDTSQGPGWWVASDGKWYRPESHPDYTPPPPAHAAPSGTTPSLTSPGATVGVVASDPVRSPKRLSRTQWVMLGALVLSVIGLLMTWASLAFASVTGINTGDGKFLGVVVLIAAGILAWRVLRLSRFSGIVLMIAWIAILGIAIAEIVHVTTTHASLLGSSIDVSVGSGLYVNAIAAVVGLVAAVIDTKSTWKAGTTSRTVTSQVQVSAPVAGSVATPPIAASDVETAGPAAGSIPTSIGSQVAGEANGLSPGSANEVQTSPARKSRKTAWLVVAGVVVLAIGGGAGVLAAKHKSGTSASGQSLPYTQSGSGIGKTANFASTGKSFRFKWSFTCPQSVATSGMQQFETFSVGVADSHGRYQADSSVNVQGQLAGSGESDPYFGPPGTYQLQVNNVECQWQLTVIQG